MQLLQPLAILDIALTSRHMLGLPRIDQQYFETSLFELLEQGDPVNAGRFHGHGFYAAVLEPLQG